MPTHMIGEKSIEQKMKMKKEPAKKEMKHMLIKEGENGGHIIEHHFENDMGPYHEPESHVFGEGDGMKAHEHIMKHMHMPMEEKEEPDEAAGKDEDDVTGVAAE